MLNLVSVILRFVFAKFGWAGASVPVLASLVVGSDLVLDGVKAHVVSEAGMRLGIDLDPEEPWSDASVSAALSAKSGIAISSVADGDVLIRDLSVHASDQIFDRSGVRFTNLLSEEKIREDATAFGAAYIAEKTGVALSDITDPDAIERDLRSHLEDKMTTIVADRLRAAAADFTDVGATVEQLLGMVRRGQDTEDEKQKLRYRVREVGLAVSASLVLAAYAELSETVKHRVRRFRRQEQLREAQRRFRAAHGARMRYQKL